MNKKVKVLLVICAVLVGIYLIVVQTGILRIFKNATVANEPSLRINSFMLVSNLVNPENGDFICYKYGDTSQIRIQRLCGKANDKIQIMDGVLFINDIDVDKKNDFKHLYQIAKAEYIKIKSTERLSNYDFVFPDGENVKTFLSDSIAQKYSLNSNKIIEEKGKIDEYIKRTFQKDWNKDNFGPIIIPEGKVFVLGDNRDNSEDSRYIGFINEDDISGVIIKKY